MVNKPIISTTFQEKHSKSSLNAIGILAKKAKEIELRKYVEAGVPENIMALVNEMKTKKEDSHSNSSPGPVQQALTKRKGTIAVVAEYKRRLESAGYGVGLKVLEMVAYRAKEVSAYHGNQEIVSSFLS